MLILGDVECELRRIFSFAVPELEDQLVHFIGRGNPAGVGNHRSPRSDVGNGSSLTACQTSGKLLHPELLTITRDQYAFNVRCPLTLDLEERLDLDTSRVCASHTSPKEPKTGLMGKPWRHGRGQRNALRAARCV